MKLPGFASGTYTDHSVAPASDRCKNLYPHTLTGAGAPEAQKVLVHTPGYTPDFSFPFLDHPIEFIWREPSTGVLMVVTNNTVIINNTAFGPIGPGPYQMASNGTQVMLSCAGDFSGYIINLGSISMSKITSAGFLGTTGCVMLDNYFVSQVPNSRKIQISALQDGTTWDAIDWATANGGPENIAGLLVDHGELWIFCREHTEIWQNTGNANFPLERIKSISITQGAISQNAMCAVDNTVYWVGRDEHGYCRTFRAEGYIPKAVSTRSVEYFFNMYASESATVENILKTVRMYAYQNESGHTFIVINWPDATSDIGGDGKPVVNTINGAQWVYDIGENEWHERMNVVGGKETAGRGLYHAFSNGKHYVGGGGGTGAMNLYIMDENTYTDNGQVIPRYRRTPHITNGLKWIRYNFLRLSAKVGFCPTAGAADAAIYLRVSNDGGNTWSNPYMKSLGHLGEYKKEICWRQLGRAKRRSFEFSTSVMAPVCLIDADMGVDGES